MKKIQYEKYIKIFSSCCCLFFWLCILASCHHQHHRVTQNIDAPVFEDREKKSLIIKKKYFISDLPEIRQIPNFSEINSLIKGQSFNISKKPNIYFIFFDTLRPDFALKFSPDIKEFFETNFSFQNAQATGTATWYSTFSLFHGVPAFLTYPSIDLSLSKEDYGSSYIKILNQMGYKINIYGFSWSCIENSQNFGTDWSRFLVSFFGWNTNLLDRCKTDFLHDQKYMSNRDEITVAELKNKLPNTITTPEGHMTFISLYDLHAPYKWGVLEEIDPIAEIREDGFCKPEFWINCYINAVKSAGINFKNLMEILKELPGSEEAIIVLLSDHGEMLYEYGEVGHGGIPYTEKNKILLSFKFGQNFPFNRIASASEMASIGDVFPTLFDYLHIEVPSKFTTGKSLLRNARNSVLTVQSAGVDATRSMILENETYKAWINVSEPDFYHSRSFELLNLTDIPDNQIPEVEHICFEKSDFECREILLSLFGDALLELYPNLYLDKEDIISAHSK